MRILRIVSLMIRELITSRELTYKILANLLFMRVWGNRELNYQEVKIQIWMKISKLGFCLPFSMDDIWLLDIFNLSASSACFIRNSFRRILMRFPIPSY